MYATYFLPLSGPDGSVTLRRRETCPPYLQKGMGVGFDPDSTFQQDEYRIEAIHWRYHDDEFHVQLDAHRYEKSALSPACNYLDQWRVHLECPWDDLDDALTDWDENEGAGYAIVELDFQFYWVNFVELRLLCIVHSDIVIHRNLTGWEPNS